MAVMDNEAVRRFFFLGVAWRGGNKLERKEVLQRKKLEEKNKARRRQLEGDLQVRLQ